MFFRHAAIRNQIEQQADQRNAETKTELAIDIPECAGISKFAVGDVNKSRTLGRAAAQAAAKSHQGESKYKD